jgi:hypothetical protein
MKTIAPGHRSDYDVGKTNAPKGIAAIDALFPWHMEASSNALWILGA